MTLRIATTNGQPTTASADPIERMLTEALRRDLAFRLFVGTAEGIVKLRGVLSDAAALDMLAVAVGKIEAALEELKKGEGG